MSETNVVWVSSASNDGGYVSYSTLPVGDKGYARMDGERFFTHSFLLDSFRKIMGRTLTLIDASVQDKQQNKAMKDIIRSVFSDEMEFASEWGFDQKKMQNMIPPDIDPKDLGEVSIEKVLGLEE